MKLNVQPLIEARRLKRWTRARLAVEIGVSENMIYKIEHGVRTSERTIFKMSAALNVPMRKILIGESDESVVA